MYITSIYLKRKVGYLQVSLLVMNQKKRHGENVCTLFMSELTLLNKKSHFEHLQLLQLSMMLRFSPAKSDVADDIDAIITPPFKGSNWACTDTPSSRPQLDGSYTEVSVSFLYFKFNCQKLFFCSQCQ